MRDVYKSQQPLRLFPERLFYKIGEVSDIVGLEAYVLRYWETEFPFLKPRKSKSGQRIYTKNEIDLILQIKHLLYHEKYTIEGVRKKLGSGVMAEGAEIKKMQPEAKSEPKGDATAELLTTVKGRLRKLLDTLT